MYLTINPAVTGHERTRAYKVLTRGLFSKLYGRNNRQRTPWKLGKWRRIRKNAQMDDGTESHEANKLLRASRQS